MSAGHAAPEGDAEAGAWPPRWQGERRCNPGTPVVAGSPPVGYREDGDVAYITLDRPDKLNALNPEVFRLIGAHVARFSAGDAGVAQGVGQSSIGVSTRLSSLGKGQPSGAPGDGRSVVWALRAEQRGCARQARISLGAR